MIEVLSRLVVNSESAPALNQFGHILPLTHPSARLGVHSAFNQPDAFRDRNEAKQQELDTARFPCSKCHVEKLRSEFWAYDHGLRNSRALLCKVCQPTPPAERRAAKASKLHTCQVCKVDKARDDYWSKDYYERNSPRAVLSCKSCNPTPPEQRQPKQMGRPAKGSSQT